MSQEEETTSQSSCETRAWHTGDHLESQEEVIAESSDNLEWDNYRENPSFALDPEEDTSQEQVEEVTVHQAGRVSSTDEQFLDRELPPAIKPFVFDYNNQDNQYSVWPPRNLSSEPDLFFEESLLPRELLASIEEEDIDDTVFLEEDSNTIEETMPPKAAPTPAQIYASSVFRRDLPHPVGGGSKNIKTLVCPSY